jgi:uncharacterized protein YciI
MPLYVITTSDKPGMLETRIKVRPEHLDYLKAVGVVKVAGPFLDAAGDMVGSLLIVDVADEAAAREFAANDPYAKAGVFAEVQVRGWRHGFGELQLP